MKAVVFETYGSPDVLQLKEVEQPTTKDDEVLVEVHAASVNYVDWQVLSGKSLLLRVMNGLFKPRHNILGDDLAGMVATVGPDVKRFQPGDEVFGISNFNAFAEFACVPEKALALKPSSMTFEQAAALPEAGITALQGIRNHGQVQAGDEVLIVGASGGVGSYAIQIAKALDAHVSAVCSTNKADFVRSVGADLIIDYTQEDFTKSGQLYDLIFAVGGNRSLFDYRRALKPNGIYVCAGGSTAQYFSATLLGPLLSMRGSQKLGSFLTNPNQVDYDQLIKLFEAGKVFPAIDQRFTLSEVSEALRYYSDGHVKGKIVINVAHDNEI